MRILGLDVSSNTGAVMLDAKNNIPWCAAEWNFPLRTRAKTLIPFVERIKSYDASLFALLNNNLPVDFVVFEGYGFSQVQSKDSIILTTSIGYALRQTVHSFDIPYIEVPTTSLKKFLLGTGVGKKDKILLETFKRWGFDAATDNIADAYCLAKFGMALAGLEEMPKGNMEALAKVIEMEQNTVPLKKAGITICT